MKASRDVLLLEDISNDSVKSIIEYIIHLNRLDDEAELKEIDYVREPITLMISSCGGECYPARALTNTIINSKTEVNTVNIGVCYSSALTIYLAGENRSAYDNSDFLYHNSSYSTTGDLTHMRRDITLVESESLKDKEFICSRTLIEMETMNECDDRRYDWIISKSEAIKLGIINL